MNTYILDTPLSSNDESIYKKKKTKQKRIREYLYIGVVSFLISYDAVRSVNFFKAES